MRIKSNKVKSKLNKKLVAVVATVGAVVTITTATCFAADPVATGTLPAEVNTMFSTLATGLVTTIGAIAVIALAVFAAPQAIVFAKKIFKKVSG